MRDARAGHRLPRLMEEGGNRGLMGGDASSRAPAATLSVSALLNRLTPEELLVEAGGGVRLLTVRRNKDVLVAGKRYGAVYVNHAGWLLRYKILHNGSRQVIDFILPGQMFGLQACLFQKSLYSVASITESSLSEIPFDIVDNMFERSPRLARALFWSILSETAIVGEHLIDAARRSAYERLSHLLLELYVRLKASGLTHGMAFEMPLTQELLGDAVGLTTVHVNRTMRCLREDKLLAVDGKRVTILDFEGLCAVCDFESSSLGTIAHTLATASNASKPAASASQSTTQISTPARRCFRPAVGARLASGRQHGDSHSRR